MIKNKLLQCAVLGSVFLTPLSLKAQIFPTALINDLGIITTLTGNSLTEGALSAVFDEGLPAVIGLLSGDSPLSPIVEQGVPFILQTAEPILVFPYSIQELSGSQGGMMLPGL